MSYRPQTARPTTVYRPHTVRRPLSASDRSLVPNNPSCDFCHSLSEPVAKSSPSELAKNIATRFQYSRILQSFAIGGPNGAVLAKSGINVTSEEILKLFRQIQHPRACTWVSCGQVTWQIKNANEQFFSGFRVDGKANRISIVISRTDNLLLVGTTSNVTEVLAEFNRVTKSSKYDERKTDSSATRKSRDRLEGF